ncbi:MAG: dTDP-4-dehydrorhamnose 3,5-epimerase [Steroidobacteraceae bacterium]
MQIAVERTHIDGVLIVSPEVFQDQRGFFLEVFRADLYKDHGLPTQFVQFNHSGSVKNTVRGLHFQWDPPMGKLMRVSRGSAFLVAVDIRRGSPTLGQWYGAALSDQERRLIWAPAGFARGFAVLSDFAEIEYLTTGIYNPAGESGVRWNDPEIGIKWPVSDPITSAKDAKAQTLSAWLERPESNNFGR